MNNVDILQLFCAEEWKWHWKSSSIIFQLNFCLLSPIATVIDIISVWKLMNMLTLHTQLYFTCIFIKKSRESLQKHYLLCMNLVSKLSKLWTSLLASLLIWGSSFKHFHCQMYPKKKTHSIAKYVLILASFRSLFWN